MNGKERKEICNEVHASLIDSHQHDGSLSVYDGSPKGISSITWTLYERILDARLPDLIIGCLTRIISYQWLMVESNICAHNTVVGHGQP